MALSTCDESCGCACTRDHSARLDALYKVVSKSASGEVFNERTKEVEHVLEAEEQEYLRKHDLPGRERNLVGSHSNRLCQRVE